MTTASTPMRPALRYHGAKFRAAPWLLRFFPQHGCYVESFGGAAGVLLQKPRAYAEIYNDLDGEIVNFFRVVRDRGLRADLIAACKLTPYAREEFDQAFEPSDDPVERARRTAIRAAMGFGSAGATKGKTGFRIDTRRKHGTAQHIWAGYPDDLAAIGERFTGVLIENRPAISVMRAHDGPETLHFIDPPYPLATRMMDGAGKDRYYRHEMTDAQHEELLEAALALDGMVIISSYPNELYATRLAGWEMHETTSRISAARGAALRTERVWLNPACSAELRQAGPGLFADEPTPPTPTTMEN